MNDSILERIKSQRDRNFENFKPGVYCLIDYFKVSFNNCGWFANHELVRDLLNCLKINYQDFDCCGGARNYKKRFSYGEGFDILTDPDESAIRPGVENYFILELKGSGCRHFEERCCSWKDLFNICEKYKAVIHRIDVAVDDMKGYINLEGLKERLSSKWYVTDTFRKSSYKQETSEGLEGFDYSIEDKMDIFDKYNGWSCTLGSRQSLQLQFYDKHAERESKNIDLLVNHWIRCEMRFYDYKAINVFPILKTAIDNDMFCTTAMALLNRVITIKDDCSKYDENNYYKAATWIQWANFMNQIPFDDYFKVSGKNRVVTPETLVSSRLKWAEKSWKNTLIMMLSALGVHDFCNLLLELAHKALEEGKVTNVMVEAINSFALNELGLYPRSKKVIINDLVQTFSMAEGEIEKLMNAGNMSQLKDMCTCRRFGINVDGDDF